MLRGSAGLRSVADLVGLPYKAHGRGEDGVDCFGLVWLIAMRNGTPIPDPWHDGHEPGFVELAGALGLRRIESIQPGCMIEMEAEGALHLGCALDMGRMIHATKDEGVVVDSIGKYPVKGYWAFKESAWAS